MPPGEDILPATGRRNWSDWRAGDLLTGVGSSTLVVCSLLIEAANDSPRLLAWTSAMVKARSPSVLGMRSFSPAAGGLSWKETSLALSMVLSDTPYVSAMESPHSPHWTLCSIQGSSLPVAGEKATSNTAADSNRKGLLRIRAESMRIPPEAGWSFVNLAPYNT